MNFDCCTIDESNQVKIYFCFFKKLLWDEVARGHEKLIIRK